MRVVVTGGSGKLGSAVVADLAEHGYAVHNVDLFGAVGSAIRLDLSEFGQAVEALSGIENRYDGVDAVVHLAAVPAPGLIANAETFRHNITVTHNVFAAARLAGVRNVVWASSETLLGLPFDTLPPPYFPVDEEFPARPQSSYALAKHLEEQMAAQFCRWDPSLKMIGLRFSNVMAPDDYAAFPGYSDDPRQRSWNAWGYIDARDGAQAVRLALESDITGMEIFVIANADTVMSQPSADLAASVFPDVPFKRPVEGTETLLSIDKARRLLGYAPQHGWRAGGLAGVGTEWRKD
jgi:nucleoside-diphosphate-sugar epimerase